MIIDFAKRNRMRAAWLQIHLWLGITLGVLGAFIGISGSILVFDHDIDAWLNPQRYSVNAIEGKPTLAYSEYLARAQQVAPAKVRVTQLRLPDEQGQPVAITLRGRGEGGGSYTAYLDPADGRLIELSDGGGAIGWMHRFHEYLLIRDYNGRTIVGAVGFGMLISSLSGLYLWWPARGRFREALGFRRGIPITRNLHYFCGFYACLILAMLSFTGIYLAFPEASRDVVGVLMPVSPMMRNVQGSQDADSAKDAKPITVDVAAATAQAIFPTEKIWSITMPNGPRGTYRITLSEPGYSQAQPGRGNVVFIDNSGAVVKQIDAAARSSGDTFIITQRALHSGKALGLPLRIANFIVGFLPALFVITGITMWLRKRRRAR